MLHLKTQKNVNFNFVKSKGISNFKYFLQVRFAYCPTRTDLHVILLNQL